GRAGAARAPRGRPRRGPAAAMVVRVRGLQAAAHLNDMQGMCMGFDEEKGRWHVQLENGDLKALKPDNFVPVMGSGGPDLTLEGGRVVHVPVGSVAPTTDDAAPVKGVSGSRASALFALAPPVQ
ncbi:unnamed protein product, partial [Prorocentrum cordatum]